VIYWMVAFWMILSDLGKYSVIQSIAWPFCDSWPCCGLVLKLVWTLNDCRKCRWWLLWSTTIASVRPIRSAASRSAALRPAPSWDTGATCSQTRADPLHSGTRCRKYRRSSSLLATSDSARRAVFVAAWMLWTREMTSSCSVVLRLPCCWCHSWCRRLQISSLCTFSISMSFLRS